jgi:hypothetical protein
MDRRLALAALALLGALAQPRAARADTVSGTKEHETGSDKLGARHTSSFVVEQAQGVSKFFARHGVGIGVLGKRFKVWETRAQLKSEIRGDRPEPPGGLVAVSIGSTDLEVNAAHGFNITRYVLKAPMQLSVGPVPIYIELAVGASVGITPELSRPSYRETRLSARISTGINGRAEVGVGTSWARVSVEGTYKPLGLNLKNQVTVSPDATTAEVLADVSWSYGLGVKAKVGWFSYKYNFVSGGGAYGDASWVLFRGIARR